MTNYVHIIHDKDYEFSRVLTIWIHWPGSDPSVDPDPNPDSDLGFLGSEVEKKNDH